MFVRSSRVPVVTELVVSGTQCIVAMILLVSLSVLVSVKE